MKPRREKRKVAIQPRITRCFSTYKEMGGQQDGPFLLVSLDKIPNETSGERVLWVYTKEDAGKHYIIF